MTRAIPVTVCYLNIFIYTLLKIQDVHNYYKQLSRGLTLDLVLLLHPLLAKLFSLLLFRLLQRAWQNRPISSQKQKQIIRQYTYNMAKLNWSLGEYSDHANGSTGNLIWPLCLDREEMKCLQLDSCPVFSFWRWEVELYTGNENLIRRFVHNYICNCDGKVTYSHHHHRFHCLHLLPRHPC